MNPLSQSFMKTYPSQYSQITENINTPHWLCLYFNVALSTIQFLHTKRMSIEHAFSKNCLMNELWTNWRCWRYHDVWCVKCQWRFLIAIRTGFIFYFYFYFLVVFIIYLLNVSICDIDESRIDCSNLFMYFATLWNSKAMIHNGNRQNLTDHNNQSPVTSLSKSMNYFCKRFSLNQHKQYRTHFNITVSQFILLIDSINLMQI